MDNRLGKPLASAPLKEGTVPHQMANDFWAAYTEPNWPKLDQALSSIEPDAADSERRSGDEVPDHPIVARIDSVRSRDAHF